MTPSPERVRCSTVNLAAELRDTEVTVNAAMHASAREQHPEHVGADAPELFARHVAEGTLITPSQHAAPAAAGSGHLLARSA
jgi:hypothetical protein